MSRTSVSREEKGPYSPGLVIKSGDTIYLTEEELLLLKGYRQASPDDRRLAARCLKSRIHKNSKLSAALPVQPESFYQFFSRR